MSAPEEIPRRARFAAAILIGLALLAVTVIWWFFYYSQYDGPSKELALKAPCIAVTTEDCLAMQKRLSGSSIPGYHPVLLWAGVIVLGLGLVQQCSRRS